MTAFFIVGNGRWSDNYRKTVIHSKYFLAENELDSNCSSADISTAIKENFDKNGTIAIIATNPLLQSEIVAHLRHSQVPLIIEKPFCVSKKSYDVLVERLDLQKDKTLCGLFCNLNHGFIKFRSKILNKKEDVKKINIIFGKQGPYRAHLPAYFDWFPHVYGILQSFFSETLDIEVTEESFSNGSTYKILYSAEGITGSGVFGNGFLERKQLIEVYFENGERITYDFNKPQIRNKPEMQRLIKLSSLRFNTSNNLRNCFYSPFFDNDEFIRKNAKLTELFGRNFL